MQFLKKLMITIIFAIISPLYVLALFVMFMLPPFMYCYHSIVDDKPEDKEKEDLKET